MGKRERWRKGERGFVRSLTQCECYKTQQEGAGRNDVSCTEIYVLLDVDYSGECCEAANIDRPIEQVEEA